MPEWLEAAAWGLAGGLSLIVGALVACWVRVPRAVVAGAMAFGAGVLISALAFELVDEAERTGGLGATVVGFAIGALGYVAANAVLARRGAKHRKRSGEQQPSEAEAGGSGAAIALGALLDGVPESVVLGVSVLGGGAGGIGMLAAVAISNFPEGLSSSAGMRRAGRSFGYILGVWSGIALAGGLAALFGAATLADASPQTLAVITSVAAGAILAMLADTMIPEAFEEAGVFTGLVTTMGFLTAFAMERIGS